ncbi:MAG: protein kinase [Planctomycetes bacterium]|nr:protein kinase [Planctomycetota bacterium]
MTDPKDPKTEPAHDGPGPAGPRPSDPFRQLLAECIDAMAQSGSGAIEPILAANPEHANALRDRIGKLVRAGLLATEPEPSAAIPEQLGEFRLQKRIGAGGMGVVYLAEQQSLKRTVALKLVRPEQRFFPGARERFRREVEAVARLGDPGIVPIYSVGEEDGISFFTMEYVRGASLADVIATVHGSKPETLEGRDVAQAAADRGELEVPTPLPELFRGSWVQTCCRIVLQMARAAQHAHERGVVHRDLKPSNAMVTPDGRVLLLDFGLAAAEGTLRITRTGTQLGTLHYMAPEQLLEAPTDARTDVYALGVTLHELLALQPPFHAEQAEKLRRAVLDGKPRSLRAANPDVPRDIETLIACAMDREPLRRYATARDLASDLDRFLAHRPIEARPASAMLRLRRYSQRHPTVATVAVLALLASIVMPIVITAAREGAERERLVAEQTARANLKNAVDAIGQMQTQARNAALSSTPGLDPVRLAQLDTSITLLRSLLAQNQNDAQMLILYSRGLTNAAQVRQLSGQNEAVLLALDEADRSLAAAEKLPGGAPSTPSERLGIHLLRATTFVALGRHNEARTIWQHTVEELGKTPPESLTTRQLQALSTCHHNLSRLLLTDGNAEAAEREIDLAIAYSAKIPPEHLSPESQLDDYRTAINRGNLLLQRNQTPAAETLFRSTKEQLEAFLKAHPGNPTATLDLSRALYCLSELAMGNKKKAEADGLREQALAGLREITKLFPDRVDYLQQLGLMEFRAACDLHASGELQRAETSIQSAIAHHEQFLKRLPRHPEATTELATFLRQLSGLQFKKDPAKAVSTLAGAITMQESMVAEHGDDAHYRTQLAELLQELGIYHWRAERWQEARDAWTRAANAYEAALPKNAAVVTHARRLPLVLQVLAQAELMCDDFAGVVRALARLQEVKPLDAETLQSAGEGLHVADREDFQKLVEQTKARAKK